MYQLHGNGAIFSEDDTYRYLLWRTWDESLPRLLWVLLNPSTANAGIADPTLSACIGFSQESHYGGLEIVNLFAYKTPDRQELKKVNDAIGPENDRHILAAAQRATRVIVGWGEDGAHQGRDKQVIEILKQHAPQLYCIGKNQNGSPRHPLYVARSTALSPYP